MCTKITWGSCYSRNSNSAHLRWGLRLRISSKLPWHAESHWPSDDALHCKLTDLFIQILQAENSLLTWIQGMCAGGIRTSQPRCTILSEKPSFIEEKDQVNTESLSKREMEPGVEGSGNNFRKQEKEATTAVIEIATTLFNWINNPCFKNSLVGNLGHLKSGLGMPDPRR